MLGDELREKSRESTGLKLLGDIYSEANRESKLRWEYQLRDELRRCFVGLLRPEWPSGALERFESMVRDGTGWDQPVNPATGEALFRKTDWMVAERCRCSYRYGGVQVDPTEFPPWMVELMEACMPFFGLKRRGSWPNCCNLNLYEDGGMSVGWHADDEELFQGRTDDCPILSMSLGQTRTFELRPNELREGERANYRVELRSGDLLTMEGLVQKHYQHRVPRERCTKPRINLTWRWIRKHQVKCPCGR